jgi:hypothetical protein
MMHEAAIPAGGWQMDTLTPWLHVKMVSVVVCVAYWMVRSWPVWAGAVCAAHVISLK